MSISLASFLPGASMLVVTTPQEAARKVAERAGKMAERTNLRPLGVVENMSWFVCPHCGEREPIFGEGGGQEAADTLGVPLMGADPAAAGAARRRRHGRADRASPSPTPPRQRGAARGRHAGGAGDEDEGRQAAQPDDARRGGRSRAPALARRRCVLGVDRRPRSSVDGRPPALGGLLGSRIEPACGGSDAGPTRSAAPPRSPRRRRPSTALPVSPKNRLSMRSESSRIRSIPYQRPNVRVRMPSRRGFRIMHEPQEREQARGDDHVVERRLMDAHAGGDHAPFASSSP